MYEDVIQELARKRAQNLAPRAPKESGSSNLLEPIGGIAGAIIGGIGGGPAGAMQGYSIGKSAGSVGDSLLSGKAPSLGQLEELDSSGTASKDKKKQSMLLKLFELGE